MLAELTAVLGRLSACFHSLAADGASSSAAHCSALRNRKRIKTELVSAGVSAPVFVLAGKTKSDQQTFRRLKQTGSESRSRRCGEMEVFSLRVSTAISIRPAAKTRQTGGRVETRRGMLGEEHAAAISSHLKCAACSVVIG